MPNIHQEERNRSHKKIESVDFKTALSIYDQRHTHKPTTYSKPLQQQPKPTTSTQSTNITPSTSNNTQTQPNRKITNYDDLHAHPNKPQ